MSLTTKRLAYRPFEYDRAYEYWEKQQNAHWLPFEVAMSKDIQDWKHSLTESERLVVGQILKSFTQMEISVNDYWSNKIIKWFPKPEIAMMASTFGAMESVHTVGYAYLNDSLGLDNYSAFMKDETAIAKLDRLQEAKGNSKKEIAKSLAIFSAFTEGVNLFSSFAVLMNFSRFNLLEGVETIVSWSVKDECVTPETEILTQGGWIRIDKWMPGIKIAIFNPDTQKIEFEHPKRFHTSYIDNKDIYNLNSTKNTPISQKITSNHRIYYRDAYNDKPWTFKYAKDFKTHSDYSIPISGLKVCGATKLTNLQRLLIAGQADGSVSDRYTSEGCGTQPIIFNLTKKRKIDRLYDIISKLNYNFTENRVGKGTLIKVDVPVKDFNIQNVKSFNWVNFKDMGYQWGQDFIQELVEWDDHRPPKSDFSYYSSISKENAEVVQTIAHLSGMSARITVQKDNRQENYKDIFRVCIQNKTEKRLGCADIKAEKYTGTVHCFEVSTGAFLIKHNDNVSVTGNSLHSDAGCWLFRTLIEENPDIWDDELKKDIYDAARLTVKLEDDFIDHAFSLGDIRGLDPKDLKNFIRMRANSKLYDLGLKNNWKNIDQESLDRMSWFDDLSGSVAWKDFFSGRVVDYSKSNFTIDNLFEEVDK